MCIQSRSHSVLVNGDFEWGRKGKYFWLGMLMLASNTQHLKTLETHDVRLLRLGTKFRTDVRVGGHLSSISAKIVIGTDSMKRRMPSLGQGRWYRRSGKLAGGSH